MDHPDITACIKEADAIEKMYMDLLDGTTQKRMKQIDDGSTGLQNVEYSICVINSKNEPLQDYLLQKYGDWYQSCGELVLKYAIRGSNSRREGLSELHERIISLINLKDSIRNSNEKKTLKTEFIFCLDAQVNALHVIDPISTSAKGDHDRMIATNLLISKLQEAESLCEQGSISSAEITISIALERFLKTLCEVDEVELESEDTVITMARKLLDSNRISAFDYEMPGLIESLAALNDMCANIYEKPQENEVRELIDIVWRITFLSFY